MIARTLAATVLFGAAAAMPAAADDAYDVAPDVPKKLAAILGLKRK